MLVSDGVIYFLGKGYLDVRSEAQMQMQVRLGGCNADVMLGKFDLSVKERKHQREH